QVARRRTSLVVGHSHPTAVGLHIDPVDAAFQADAGRADHDRLAFVPRIDTLTRRFRIAKWHLTEAAGARTEAFVNREAAAGAPPCLLYCVQPQQSWWYRLGQRPPLRDVACCRVKGIVDFVWCCP